MSLNSPLPKWSLYHPQPWIYNIEYINYMYLYYKLVHLMMFLDQIKLLRGIIGYPKDEYQLVMHLFMLIMVILWSIMYCYGHFYHYSSYKNGSFMIFFYLICAYDSLLYALVILKSSVPTVKTPPALSIAGVQSLPAVRCAYAPYTSSPFCTIYHPWAWIYNIFYIYYLYLYYKWVHLMMNLHQNRAPKVITGHRKDEYRLLIHLFMLISFILWCNIHWYCHCFHYKQYNNKWNFSVFFYLITVCDLLFNICAMVKQSTQSIYINSIGIVIFYSNSVIDWVSVCGIGCDDIQIFRNKSIESPLSI
eukprot:243371_1